MTQIAINEANARRLAVQNNIPTDLPDPSPYNNIFFYIFIKNNTHGQQQEEPTPQQLAVGVNRVKELIKERQLQFVVDASAVEALKSPHCNMLTNVSVSTGFSAWLFPGSEATYDFIAQAEYKMLYGDGAPPSLSDAAVS